MTVNKRCSGYIRKLGEPTTKEASRAARAGLQGQSYPGTLEFTGHYSMPWALNTEPQDFMSGLLIFRLLESYSFIFPCSSSLERNATLYVCTLLIFTETHS